MFRTLLLLAFLLLSVQAIDAQEKQERQPVRLPYAKNPQPRLGRDGLTTTVVLGSQADRLVGDLIWTAAGDAFYSLTVDGTLSLMSLPTFEVVRQAEMGPDCVFLALSAEGLLVARKVAQEVCLVDPASFKVTKKFPAAGIRRVLSAPGLRFALFTHTDRTGRDGEVSYVDLVQGKIVNRIKLPMKHARITPDGQYVFSEGGVEQLAGYRISGTSLIADGISDRIAASGQSVCVSPDSKLVCLPAIGGNGRSPNPHCTHIYEVDEVRNPLFEINSGPQSQLLAFDPKNQLIYAQNGKFELLVYNRNGVKLKEYLPSGEGDIRQLVPHPQGGKLLVVNARTVLFAELPADSATWHLVGPKEPTTKIHPDGLKTTVIRGVRAYKLVGDLIWTPKGDAFYALTTDGDLTRVSVQSFEVEKLRTLGPVCSFLALSKQGLLVVKKDLQEIWVIDPTKFTLKNKISVWSVQRVLARPESSMALVGSADKLGGNSKIGFLDLEKGKVINEVSVPVRHGRISPDGKYYFAHDGAALWRYRIDEKGALQADETSEPIAPHAQSIFISSDSKLVCIPTFEGNGRDATTYIFGVEEIRTPRLKLDYGAAPLTVGFDVPGRCIYTQNRENLLIVFSMDGIKLHEYLPTGSIGEDTLQFVAHPQGRKVLLATSKRVIFAELPTDGGVERDR